MRIYFCFLSLAFSFFICSCNPKTINSACSEPAFFSENKSFSEHISHQNIEVIYENHWGYIWIGTARGLNKFNWILSIMEDRKKHLWIGTKTGVCRLDDQDCFERFEIEGNDNRVENIYENSKGE